MFAVSLLHLLGGETAPAGTWNGERRPMLRIVDLWKSSCGLGDRIQENIENSSSNS